MLYGDDLHVVVLLVGKSSWTGECFDIDERDLFVTRSTESGVKTAGGTLHLRHKVAVVV